MVRSRSACVYKSIYRAEQHGGLEKYRFSEQPYLSNWYHEGRIVMRVLGLDPGGANAFGWAVISGSFANPIFIAGGVTSGASNAIKHATLHLQQPPEALGIDAPLFWSPKGDRLADKLVRAQVRAVGGHNGVVGHVNSLRGACLVEGLIAAQIAKNLWPRVQITEAHPKALMLISGTAGLFAVRSELHGVGHHIRDAALSALAALALIEQVSGWHDLATLEPERCEPLGITVSYWFPQEASICR
jgi:hypothetical protein